MTFSLSDNKKIRIKRCIFNQNGCLKGEMNRVFLNQYVDIIYSVSMTISKKGVC